MMLSPPTIDTMAQLMVLIEDVEARDQGELTEFLKALLYRKIVTPDDVLAATQETLAVSIPSICSMRRTTELVRARAICTLVMKALCEDASSATLAKCIGRSRSAFVHMHSYALDTLRSDETFAGMAMAVRRRTQARALSRLKSYAQEELASC